jgi:hypothetical protein
VIAVVRRLSGGRGCDVEVYAREGGVLAAWSFVARARRYREIVGGMPSLVKTIFKGARAARVGADGQLTHAPRDALAPVRLRPVSAVAARCMIKWNDSAVNASGLQLAADLASSGTLRAAVGADSSGRCLVVLGQVAAGAAIVFEASHGTMQRSFGAFFPASGGQAIPLVALDRSMKAWNATAHVNGCISPRTDPGARCPVTAVSVNDSASARVVTTKKQ